MRDKYKEIKYKIEKSKEENKYLVVRYCESKRGYNIGKVYEGTRQECLKEKERLENV